MFSYNGLAEEIDYDTLLKAVERWVTNCKMWVFNWSWQISLVALSDIRFCWDIENGIIFVKEERIQKLEKCLTYALCQVEKGYILFRIRFLASIVGQLISIHAVFRDTVR
jgi:hypothetical protein